MISLLPWQYPVFFGGESSLSDLAFTRLGNAFVDGGGSTPLPRTNGISTTGDFNNDGNIDFVAPFDSGITVLLGDGDGFLGLNTNYFGGVVRFGAGVTALATDDFNEDGLLDVVLTGYNPDRVSLLYNSGAGRFVDFANFGAGVNPNELVVADFNNDGHSDVAVANLGSNDVSILIGDGAGSLSIPR